MLNEQLKLNPKLFDEDVEQAPTREGYGEGLLEAGKENPQVTALCCDLTESTHMHKFRDAFPERFVEMGIQEQSMASVASGMAAMGKIPFISSYAMFSPGRNWEQIRTTICYNDRHVKLAGSHAGVSVGPDGGTHQAIEDIAITRVIPRMSVIYPCDSLQAKKATVEAARNEGTMYLRFAREKTPIITTEETPFEIGKAYTYFDVGNAEVGIIATGPLLHNALIAAKKLADGGVSVKVMNLVTIKPLPANDIMEFTEGLQGVVTVEEHQIAGGMGSAVAEFLVQKRPVKMAFIGVRDQFGQSGAPRDLIEHYGMGVSHITEAARKLIGK